MDQFIQAKLQKGELWAKFVSLPNEMLISKVSNLTYIRQIMIQTLKYNFINYSDPKIQEIYLIA